MANTSELNKINEYILDVLGKEFHTAFTQQSIKIGKSEKSKKFCISENKDIIILICHHSGRTKSGNIPSAKLSGLFSKCYFLEKTTAKEKYIYFTNKEFYKMFSSESKAILEGIQLKAFENLPEEYKKVLDKVINNASDEMM